MVRITGFIRPFWWANGSSTSARTADLAGVRRGGFGHAARRGLALRLTAMDSDELADPCEGALGLREPAGAVDPDVGCRIPRVDRALVQAGGLMRGGFPNRLQTEDAVPAVHSDVRFVAERRDRDVDARAAVFGSGVAVVRPPAGEQRCGRCGSSEPLRSNCSGSGPSTS